MRSEAKLAELDPTNPKYASTTIYTSARNQRTPGIQPVDWGIEDFDSEDDHQAPKSMNQAEQADVSNSKTPASSQGVEEVNEALKIKARKRDHSRWRALVGARFVEGRDLNFNYAIVDEDIGLDEDWSGQKAQEDWFEDEEDLLESTEGETGVQDF